MADDTTVDVVAKDEPVGAGDDVKQFLEDFDAEKKGDKKSDEKDSDKESFDKLNQSVQQDRSSVNRRLRDQSDQVDSLSKKMDQIAQDISRQIRESSTETPSPTGDGDVLGDLDDDEVITAKDARKLLNSGPNTNVDKVVQDAISKALGPIEEKQAQIDTEKNEKRYYDTLYKLWPGSEKQQQLDKIAEIATNRVDERTPWLDDQSRETAVRQMVLEVASEIAAATSGNTTKPGSKPSKTPLKSTEGTDLSVNSALGQQHEPSDSENDASHEEALAAARDVAQAMGLSG